MILRSPHLSKAYLRFTPLHPPKVAPPLKCPYHDAMKQRGNILFLILLAVVLFAALAYAVTSSLRAGGKDASSETIQAGAAAISQYVALLRSEVNRMMLINGCKPENFDWRNNVYRRYDNGLIVGSGGNSAPPVPKAGCAVFTSQGGPITPQTFDKYRSQAYEDYCTANVAAQWRGGHATFRWYNRLNEGTSRNEVGIFFGGMDIRICDALLNGATVADSSDKDIDANAAEPADYTGANNIIDAPINLTGDFHGARATYNSGTVVYCNLGATLIPQ